MSKNKRTTKWYRENEKEVMQKFGLQPTKNSGSGWVEKEDGENSHVVCQLKSTDADSISIKKKDIEILEHNADIAHKYPLFMIQFIKTDEAYILMRPSDIKEIAQYIETGECKKNEKLLNNVLTGLEDSSTMKEIKSIKSDASAREAFHTERTKRFDKDNKKKRWC